MLKIVLSVIMISISSISIAQDSLANLKIGKLRNGFSYYIHHNQRAGHETKINFIVNVGNLHENSSEKQMSHLLEHVAGRSSRNFKNGIFRFCMESGVNFNFGTGHTTNYRFILPQDLSLFSKILLAARDIAGDLLLKPEEIDEEKHAVLAEITASKGNNPEAAITRCSFAIWDHKLNYHAAYTHNHQDNIDNLKATSPEQLQSFYRKWYTADRMAIIIDSSLDPDIIFKQIDSLFGNLEAAPNKVFNDDSFKIKLTGSNQYFTIADSALTFSRILIDFKKQKKVTSATEAVKAAIYNNMLQTLVNNRFQNLLEQGKLGLNMLSFKTVDDPRLDRAKLMFFRTWVDIQECDKFDSLILSVAGILKGIKKYGFIEPEFQEVKTKLLEEFSKTGVLQIRYSIIEQCIQHFIYGDEILLDSYILSSSKNILRQLNYKSLNRYANEVIQMDHNLDVGMFYPAKCKSSITSENALANLFRRAKPLPYSDTSSDFKRKIAAFEKRIGSCQTQADVLSTKRVDGLSMTSFLLSNGIEVTFKKIPDTIAAEKDRVTIFGLRPIGRDIEVLKSKVAPLFAVSCGTDLLSSDEIRKYSNECKSSFGLNLLNNYEQLIARGSSTKVDLLLNLFMQQLFKPGFTPALFEEWKKIYKKHLHTGVEIFQDDFMSDTTQQLRQTLISHLTKTQFNEIQLSHQKYLSDFGGYHFFIIGNYDEEDLISKVLTSFRCLAGSVSSKDIWQTGVASTTSEHKVYFSSDSNQRKTLVTLKAQNVFDYSTKDMLLLKMLEMNLRQKIYRRLREKEKDTYTPVVSLFISKSDSAVFSLNVGFYCSPDNVSHMIDAAKDEIRLMAKHGFTVHDLNTAKLLVKKGFKSLVPFDYFWMDYFGRSMQNKYPIDEILKYEAIADSIGLIEINAALRRLVNFDNFSSYIEIPIEHAPKSGN